MKIPIRKIFWSLTLVTAGILALHSFFVLSPHFLKEGFPDFLVQRFHVNYEANLPTWYSTILLFSVSMTSFFLYPLNYGLPKQKFWLGFGFLYLFLSLDEAAQMHEIIGVLTNVKWVFIYAPIVGLSFLACLYYFIVIRRKDTILRNWIIGGLIVYALGGLVCEWISYTFHLRYALQQIEFVVEEGLELMGTTMVLTGCLHEFNKQFHNMIQKTRSMSASVTK